MKKLLLTLLIITSLSTTIYGCGSNEPSKGDKSNDVIVQGVTKENNDVYQAVYNFVTAAKNNDDAGIKECTTKDFASDKRNIVYNQWTGIDIKDMVFNMDEKISDTEVIASLTLKENIKSFGVVLEDGKWKVDSLDFSNRYTDSDTYDEAQQIKDMDVANIEMGKFVSEKNVTIAVNSGLSGPIKLPSSFDMVIRGENAGKLFYELNEISKKNGYDMKGFLNGKAAYYEVRVNESTDSYVVLVKDGKLIGRFTFNNNEVKETITLFSLCGI